MSADYERKLHRAVAQFVKEADKKYPNWSERNDNGEWGIGLDKFDDMYKVILEIIEYTSCDEATEQMLDDILFGIARDNECSRIIEVLLKYPDWYVSTMYCSGEVDCICMECVANGKAAEKYDGEFIQYAEEISDEEKRTELFRRTPGYCSWQGEYWLACCDDYCEYLGDVGYAELKEMNLVSIIEEYKKVEGMDFDNEMLEKGGSLAGYLFRCIHCGKFRLNVDCD